MFLQEPPQTQADLHFSLFGIPVRVSPLFWVMGALLGLGGGGDSSLLVLAAWMVAFFVSILFHELGHALALLTFRQRPWITLYGFGGLTSHDPSYGGRRPGAWGRIFISLAGPLAGFLLAGLAFVLLFAVAREDRALSMSMRALVGSLLFINIFWGVLNLMPVFPLDGGNIARELLCLVSRRSGVRWSLVLSIVAAAALAALALFLRQWFIALLFAALAVGSYQALQQHRGERAW